MKLKVFCSLPMKDRTREEIEADLFCMQQQFEAVAVSKYGFNPNDIFEFVNNLDASDKLASRRIIPHLSVWYLHTALDLLSDCDLALFHSDWDRANGCVIEHEVCERYNIPMYYCFKEGDESAKPEKNSGRYPWGKKDSDDDRALNAALFIPSSVGLVKKAIEDAYHHAEWFFAGITDELDGDDWQDCRDMIDAFINAAVLKMKMEEKDGEA